MALNLDGLTQLCAACGIATAYRDAWGAEHAIAPETRLALLAACGFAVSDDAEAGAALDELYARDWRRPLPPVLVVRGSGCAIAVSLSLPEASAARACAWRLTAEGGERHAGEFVPDELPVEATRCIEGSARTRYRFTLPVPLAAGYHRLEVGFAGEPATATTVIVAPDRCYEPHAVADRRNWGLAVNLFSVRSGRNWGIGDFTDLEALLEITAIGGGAMVGVNPLHALFPAEPDHASPYCPASRLYLNVLYLDPERISDFAESGAARDWFAQSAVQAELSVLRGADIIDYARVAALKMDAMRRLYRHFRERHLQADTPRGRAFREFQVREGDPLQRLSRFFALQAALRDRVAVSGDWRTWPPEYRNPESPEVEAFARAYAEQIEFFDYLQWQAREQLAAAHAAARRLGLAVGIYQDLAVGAAAGGAETWGVGGHYAMRATVGCPPDEFNLKGQDWGMPPLSPVFLRESAYAPFVELLRALMRHAGAIRIDHVMGLLRQWWVPGGAAADRGGYVEYPFDDMLGVLALESVRNQCLVVGEDLGTVPDGLRERLRAENVLSYRLLYFERAHDAGFMSPGGYPAHALAAIGTHDLPTLRAFWQGRDLELRARLGLYPTAELRDRQREERARDRADLVKALAREGLLADEMAATAGCAADVTDAFVPAVYRYLARTPCRLLAVQPEIVFGEVEQFNVPATTDAAYPNWRHRIRLPLERWLSDERMQCVLRALRVEGRICGRQDGPAG